MRVTEVSWKQHFVEKLLFKHDVTTEEAEEVLRSRALFRRAAKGHVKGEDVYAALAQTLSGRYLVVYFIDKGRGVVLPISARDMDTSERKYYEKHR